MTPILNESFRTHMQTRMWAHCVGVLKSIAGIGRFLVTAHDSTVQIYLLEKLFGRSCCCIMSRKLPPVGLF